jgi:2-succinyl-6-hydroxy-2,4-cyclohexadiene-1-carboxylate synthase
VSRAFAPATHGVDVGDGLHLSVACAGSGPRVMLLHGFTGAAESWAPLLPALHDYASIAVDLPGHGRSGAPDEASRYALHRTVDDLARVLDALGVERAVVIGYSMGGRVALHFSLAHQARVAALVLESASPGIANAAERAARVESDHALADAIARDGVAAFVDRWEELPLWASQAALPRSVRMQLRDQRLRNVATGLANSLRGAGAGVDLLAPDRLAEQRAPALLVAGARDARYVAHARAMAAAMPDARVEIVRDAGHAVHLERPEALSAIVRRFLGEVASGDARWSAASDDPR